MLVRLVAPLLQLSARANAMLRRRCVTHLLHVDPARHGLAPLAPLYVNHLLSR